MHNKSSLYTYTSLSKTIVDYYVDADKGNGGNLELKALIEFGMRPFGLQPAVYERKCF